MAVLVLFACCACQPAQEPTAKAPPWFSGCGAVQVGPVCHAQPGDELSFWFPADDVVVRMDGHVLDAGMTERVAVDGGLRIVLPLADGVRSVTFATGADRYSLRVRPPQVAPELERARALDDHEAAIAALAEQVATHAGPANAAMAGRYLAQGRTDDAMRALVAARDAFRAGGWTLTAARESAALSYFQIHKNSDYVAAGAELDAARAYATPSSDGQYFLAYHDALLAFNAGDARRALDHLDRVGTLARRLGWERRQAHVEQILAIQLQRLGRRGDARRLLEKWVAHSSNQAPTCERAMLLNNLAWATILEREAGDDAPDPSGQLREAGDIASRECASSEQTNIRINQALAALQNNRAALARSYLDQIPVADLRAEPRLRDWSQFVEGELLARQGQHASAHRAFEALRERSQREGVFAMHWRSLVGSARALAAAGDGDAAGRAYAAASALVREQLNAIPLTQGRETFLAQHGAVWREHVALLLSRQQTAAAFDVLRQSRRQARAVLAIDQALPTMEATALAKWHEAIGRYQAARDELAELSQKRRYAPADQVASLEAAQATQRKRVADYLDAAISSSGASQLPDRETAGAADALTVAFLKLPGAWAVFAADQDSVDVHTPACDAQRADALADCLVAPLAPALDKVHRVVVLSGEEDAGLDLAGAALGPGQVIDRAALQRSLDLPMGPSDADQRQAVVLDDPTQSLAGARFEAEAVRGLLQKADWTVASSGGTDHDALSRRLSNATLFHFAGHAQFAGVLGWDSALRLSDSATFRVGDVLALDAPPRYVVLSGCETGSASRAALGTTGIGLGEAFVARGSHWALVTTRPVRDNATRHLTTRFYTLWLQGESPDAALRFAQLDARERGEDWTAFRLVTR